jgi:hypothetical protein
MPSVLSKLHIPFPSKKKTSAPTAKEIKEIRKLQLQKKLHCALEERRLERTGANLVSREEYDLATRRISKALEKYSKIIDGALPSIPHEPVIADIAIVNQWYMQGQTEDDKSARKKQLDSFTQRFKEVFPTWKPANNTKSVYHGAPPPLHRDAMHSIMAMLEPVEIARCMLVCKSWYKDGKSASWCWKNGILKVYQDAEDGVAAETYTAPWVAIAIRRASRIVVDSCHKPVMMYSLLLRVNKYTQLIPLSKPYIALHDELAKGSGLKNLRELVVGNYWGRATELLEKMFGHKGIERIVVHNSDIDFEIRMKILETCPNLQHAEILHHGDCSTPFKARRVCSAIAGLKSMVICVDSNVSYVDVQLNHFATVLLPNMLMGIHEEHAQLEELEIYIDGRDNILTVVNKLLMTYSRDSTVSKLRKLKIVQGKGYVSCFGLTSFYWSSNTFHNVLGKAMERLQHAILNAVKAKNQLEVIEIHLNVGGESSKYNPNPNIGQSTRYDALMTALSTLLESLPEEARKRVAELFTFKIENRR